MLGYYLQLALRTLRRNIILTSLIIAAVGVGIGAYMTVLTVLIAMSGDPIPDKSTQLFVPQIDVWGPNTRPKGTTGDVRLPPQFTYRDVTAFMQAHAAPRQAAMYPVGLDVTPPSGIPYSQTGRATYRDFFAMFQVPFQSGAAWSVKDEADRADVVVLGKTLAARLFAHSSAMGQTVSLGGRLYRVTGVLDAWSPMPRFYDVVNGNAFGSVEDFFIPFTTAIGHQMQTNGNYNCAALPPSGWSGRLSGECIWFGFWAELPDAAAVRTYRQYLNNYSAEQRRLGRFHWPPLVQLSNVHQWLALMRVIPDEVRVNSLLAFGFLTVCLVNAVGLMLARFSARASEFGVRRALGATKSDIFLQCLTETAVVGVLGGILGLALTALGLAANRASLGSIADSVTRLFHLDPAVIAFTVALAVGATLCSGLYPTWRATRVQPAGQLKAQ
ncbi:MAG TPA: ABC transporter permease [Steroidobacteraceae bacterium]|jgi:putative ABC transport system permease protein|nr:ABC transporter permease [Steroidobacteraceae bacterium]